MPCAIRASSRTVTLVAVNLPPGWNATLFGPGLDALGLTDATSKAAAGVTG